MTTALRAAELVKAAEHKHDADLDTPVESQSAAWQPLDLTDIVNGDHVPELPTIGQRDDGISLLYPGRVHALNGESEGGKTWAACVICVQELGRGQHVTYIDYEDTAGGIVSRLRALGASDSQLIHQLHYVQPSGHFDVVARSLVVDQVTASSVVVLDGVTEALADHGLSSKDDTDVASLWRRLPKWLAAQGPAVLLLDHVVKDAETRGRWATGSQHKMSGTDGAVFTLERVHPFAAGTSGKARLLVTKDRHGHVRPHSLPLGNSRYWIADLVVDATGPYLDARLAAPQERLEEWKPTALMGKLADALRGRQEPMSFTDLKDRVKGKDDLLRSALAHLIDDGFVTRQTGPRGAHLHALIKDYPEAQE